MTYAGPKALDGVPLSQLGEWVEWAAGLPTYRLTERSCEQRGVIERRAGVRASNVYRLHICGRPFASEHMDLSQWTQRATDDVSDLGELLHTPPF